MEARAGSAGHASKLYNTFALWKKRNMSIQGEIANKNV
jgi:hypothetical protein